MNNTIIALMRRSNLPRNARIQAESRICIEFADALRSYTINGTLTAVWCHIPNESKRSIVVGLIMRAMGMITGAPDYMFCWSTGSGFIEFKAGKNKQQDSQKMFQTWCELMGVKYAVSYGADDGIQILKDWGVLANTVKKQI